METLHFKSLDAKSPRAIRRELRNLFEGCIPFDIAIDMVGAGEHPKRAEFADDWKNWEAEAE